ncbi:MAG: Type 1 glutamine amidotransferase-like domain-containing protein [Clostridia bacterium]|nr:Type 1 glutamine amidotransferase-like domain-containing protein [Clostridia bacterium]
MVNILLEGYDIQAPWLYDELKNYIKPTHKISVVAFSFRDSRVKSLLDWNVLYGEDNGRFYAGIVGGFTAYGVSKDNISFINYFTDTKESARQKIENADIIYFLGGLPDRMMERIKEFDLVDVLLKHNGIIMGYSAGAVIQLSEYHLSPDEDYPEFKYYKGLTYLNDFYLEVHYEGTEAQKASIQKVISERGKTVYATTLMSGAIIVDEGDIKLLGDVKMFDGTQKK